MEATGVYTMPVYHALLEPGSLEQVLVCNAAHVKNVPGRKTDAVNASWLASCWSAGCCGARRGEVLAELARGRMRSKIGDLSRALEGRLDDHHALMCQLHLDHIAQLNEMITKLDSQVETMMVPLPASGTC
jgi:transposase